MPSSSSQGTSLGFRAIPSPFQQLATAFRPTLPANLTPDFTPLNPITFLLKSASIRPSHPAISHPEKNISWTYSEFATRVAFLAYALKSRGVKKGDKVFIVGPNVPMVAEALQAVPALQAIIVTVNVRQTEEEVAYLLQDCQASLVLVDHQFKNLVHSSTVPTIVSNDSAEPDCEYEQFLLEGQRYDQIHGNQGWAGLVFQADEMATFAISYTSGTTSRPKGVETSYRGTYLAAIGNAVEGRLGPSSKYQWILPMFHCLGWCYPYACTMAMCTQVCLRSVGDYSEIWKGFLERGVTHYSGAPTVQLSIVNHPMARKLPHPVLTTVAGAAPTASLLEALDTLGFQVCHVYGLTETYGPSCRTYFDDKSSPDYFTMMARQGAAFLTADDIRITKLIPEGDELKVKYGELKETVCNGEEIGEIVIRGNITMKGYYNNPEATAKAFAGGWFHTGDLATRYPDGTFEIKDRSKDIIISGGENISSLACESVLTRHPDVLEVAVVARKHEKWGERPHAFVVLKDPAKYKGRHADFGASLKAFARGKMPAFAIPEWVQVVPELEKTSTGKVQKKALRDILKAKL